MEKLTTVEQTRILQMVESIMQDLKNPLNKLTAAQLVEKGLVWHQVKKQHAQRVANLVEMARRGQHLR
jgi:hypothetical protein